MFALSSFARSPRQRRFGLFTVFFRLHCCHSAGGWGAQVILGPRPTLGFALPRGLIKASHGIVEAFQRRAF